MQKLSTATVSVEEFVQNLTQSGLSGVEHLRESLPSLPGTADGSALAEQLVGSGKLTRYQANALLEGRVDDLRIDSYDVLDRLGAGGMGTVFKARHRRMKRVVAVKVLSRDVTRPESFVQRFQREVETIAQLSHPNVVMAFDAGEDEIGHFLVMEFVNGRDLASEVQQRGPLPTFDAIDFVLQAARGLEYAHGKGIIHRDVKPANLIRDESGIVKVADLGLARLYNTNGSEGNSSITQSGGIVGTMDFMSPEQALDSTTVDQRTDVYSLGGTLFYLLTGQPPYSAPSLMGLLLKHSAADVPSLRTHRPDVPEELEAIYRKMMAKMPEERHASMTEVIAELEAVRPMLKPSEPSPKLVMPCATSDTDLSGLTLDVRSGEEVDVAPEAIPSATLVERPSLKASASRSLKSPMKSSSELIVVLAEPSRTQASIVRSYLQQMGIDQVYHVTSGKEATALVQKHRPQVVLSAQHLSDVTGVQLAQSLLSEGVGFVLITSEDDAEAASALPQTGRAVVTYKPFDVQRLAQSISRAAGREIPGLPSHRPTDNLQVLLVDDSSAARAHVRAVLRGLGFNHFSEAVDGSAAVELLRNQCFDLIVTDFDMPRMNGLELTTFVRRQSTSARSPILVVTTQTEPTLLEQLRQAGASAICEKSFKPDAVRVLLTQLL